MLRQLMSLGGVTLLCSTAPAFATSSESKGGKDPTKQKFMDHAFKMKSIATGSGDQAYGAVVVKDNKIVGEGPSQVIADQDPTAHAEMVAIRNAAKTLGSRDLRGCTIYSTSRPCRMCETAAYWAGLNRSYYSSEIVDGGAPEYSSC